MIKFTLEGDDVPEHLQHLAGEVLYDDSVMMTSEAILLEKMTGRHINDLAVAFAKGEVEASVAYYWTALRRVHPHDKVCQMSQLVFNMRGWKVQDITDSGSAPDPTTPATGEPAAEAGEPQDGPS